MCRSTRLKSRCHSGLKCTLTEMHSGTAQDRATIVNNYSPKWRWIAVDIYRAAYSYFIFWKNRFRAPCFPPEAARRWISLDIPRLRNQSNRAKSTIHLCCVYWYPLLPSMLRRYRCGQLNRRLIGTDSSDILSIDHCSSKLYKYEQTRMKWSEKISWWLRHKTVDHH